MSVLLRLASALGRNHEQPNVALAESLAREPDAAAVAELVAALSGPTAISNDAIKVLYELGARRPELVAGFVDVFIELAGSRNNRSVWGALQAVESVTDMVPDKVLEALPQVLAAADKGSVIAKDKAVQILVKLVGAGHWQVLPILLRRVEVAAPNQFPTYAEEAATIVNREGREELMQILQRRLEGVEGTAKRVRVQKLMRRLAREQPGR